MYYVTSSIIYQFASSSRRSSLVSSKLECSHHFISWTLEIPLQRAFSNIICSWLWLKNDWKNVLNWFWITIYCFNGLDNTSNTNKRIYLEIYFSKGSWTVLKVTLVLFILYYCENQPWRRYVVLTYVLIWVECESQIVGNNLIFLLLLRLSIWSGNRIFLSMWLARMAGWRLFSSCF